LKVPHATLTVEDESPWPDGLANGLWKGSPMKPLTTWGIALERNAPPKKYDIYPSETGFRKPSAQFPMSSKWSLTSEASSAE